MRAPVVALTEALVTLRYTAPIDDLKAAIAVQTDPEILDSLNSCLRRLVRLSKNGDDTAAWVAELSSSDKDVRKLADARLAELGTPAAVHALGTRLAATTLAPDERANLLLEIGRARTASAADLVERHLADPAFDAFELRDARAAAGYAARRLGGERMVKALRASAIRRDGRDFATLAYLAVLEKGPAADTLRTLRVRRLRYPEAYTGDEDPKLEAALADLASGSAMAGFDVLPGALTPQQ
jgi:hypothetical protein